MFNKGEGFIKGPDPCWKGKDKECYRGVLSLIGEGSKEVKLRGLSKCNEGTLFRCD